MQKYNHADSLRILSYMPLRGLVDDAQVLLTPSRPEKLTNNQNTLAAHNPCSGRV